MAVALAHCGDSDVRVSTGPGVVPSPGTFTGTLSDGGSIQIEVGSIEEVVFDCDEEVIRETFTPPRRIESDGNFNIGFSDGGREFRIRGTFRDNNTVDGTINDEDDECDVSFDAFRGGGFPTAVPTPTGGTTAAPTATTGGPNPTPTGGGTGPTPTGGGGGTNPTVTPTPGNGGDACPEGVEVLGDAGAAKVLDSGWTGLAHNATVISDGKLTFTLDCANAQRPCGTCQVGGPVQNVNADAGDINAQRCTTDLSVKCDADTPCASGTCAFYFGAPLPLSAGGIGTCVTNQVTGSVSGTANLETGAFATTINLTSRVHSGIDNFRPCPTCDNDPTLNDGQPQGTCSGGPRAGQPCDANGNSPTPAFGTTSLDCPPSGLISSLSIPLDGSSGTETVTLTNSSPACTGIGTAGKKCLCPAAGTEPTKPNACNDDTATAVDGSLCAPVSSGSTEGQCPETVDTVCSPTETFRGCLSNTDCTAPGDTCQAANRPCYLDNGIVGGSVTARGEADPPTNGRSEPTFASLFCIPPVAQAAINNAGGLPGLGRIELPLISQEIQTLP